jgi:hypothetical protein
MRPIALTSECTIMDLFLLEGRRDEIWKWGKCDISLVSLRKTIAAVFELNLC